MKPEIIVAADGMEFAEVDKLINQLGDRIWGLKFNDLLLEFGSAIVDKLCRRTNVMVDPKLFDIPNTMTNGISLLALSGASIATVHLSAGVTALKACVRAAASTKLQVFGVTVLTSMSDEEVMEVYNAHRPFVVQQFMLMARRVGLSGIVCAADSVELAKKLGLKTIVPGIRLDDILVKDDDQVHKAIGIPDADYIVVGRPITKAPDPVATVNRLVSRIHAKESASCAA
jgi:orotidine-5'-phosphate decarboxylase